MKLGHGVGVMTGGKRAGLSEEPRPGDELGGAGGAGGWGAWIWSVEDLRVDCESSHKCLSSLKRWSASLCA